MLSKKGCAFRTAYEPPSLFSGMGLSSLLIKLFIRLSFTKNGYFISSGLKISSYIRILNNNLFYITDLIILQRMVHIHKQIHKHKFQVTISPQHNYTLYFLIPRGQRNGVHR